MARNYKEIQIMIPVPLAISKKAGGIENNPHYQSEAGTIASNLRNRGWDMQNGDGYIHAQRPKNKKFINSPVPTENTATYEDEPDFSVAELEYMMSSYIYDDGNGGIIYPQVTGYDPYVKISESNINNTVPGDLPNAIIPEDNSDPENIIPSRTKTWNEYFRPEPGYDPTIKNGFYYYISYGALNGIALTGLDLMKIQNSVDAELIDEKP